MTQHDTGGVVVHRDVVHTQVEGYRPLALDLYQPVEEPRALAVYLHGGGWLRGSRRQGPGPLTPSSGRLFVRMAQQGLAVASIDYRLSGEARFPAQCDDVDAACAFLDASRSRFALGAAPLVLWGVSAGGTLAALRALDATATPPAVAVALWYAVTDLASMPGAESEQSPATREARFLGAAPGTVPELARQASPSTRAHPGAPPFLLLHGGDDDLVPTAQSARLDDALSAVGVDSTFEVVPGRSHLFAGMPDDEVEALVDRTVAFLLGAAR